METHNQTHLDPVNGAYERLTAEELVNLDVVLGAYRSFRGARRRHLAYVGMPITSGKRFYDVLTANSVVSAKELADKLGKDALWNLVIQPNIQEGIAQADRLGVERQDLLFIAPSVFEAKKWRWSQDAYMSLWYRVLGELAGKHYVLDGWEYSTGGVLEAMFTMYMRWRVIRPNTEAQAVDAFGIKNFRSDMSRAQRISEYEAMWNTRLYDVKGNEIRIDDAMSMIAAALEDLRDRGLPHQDLIMPALRLSGTTHYSPCVGWEGAPFGHGTDRFYDAYHRIDAIAKAAGVHPPHFIIRN